MGKEVIKGHETGLRSFSGNLPSEPSWIPNTHHAVPQPAGRECAQWYEWANPSASEILHALAHTKAERDRLREHNARLIAAVEAALDYCSSEVMGTVQQEIADNQHMQETLRAALEPQGETP